MLSQESHPADMPSLKAVMQLFGVPEPADHWLPGKLAREKAFALLVEPMTDAVCQSAGASLSPSLRERVASAVRTGLRHFLETATVARRSGLHPWINPTAMHAAAGHLVSQPVASRAISGIPEPTLAAYRLTAGLAVAYVRDALTTRLHKIWPEIEVENPPLDQALLNVVYDALLGDEHLAYCLSRTPSMYIAGMCGIGRRHLVPSVAGNILP
jgi:hypothetical protein